MIGCSNGVVSVSNSVTAEGFGRYGFLIAESAGMALCPRVTCKKLLKVDSYNATKKVSIDTFEKNETKHKE